MTAAANTRIAIIGAGPMEHQFRATIDRIPTAEIGLFVAEFDERLDTAAGRFDAVLIAGKSPNPNQLAGLGKPVWLSDRSLISISPTVAAFAATPENLVIATPLRFRSDIAAVKESLDSGQLGGPGLLRIHCWRQPDGGAHRCLLDEIDLACWFFGARPASVYALSRSIHSTDDYIQVHFGFPAGGMAMIDVNTSLPPGDSYRSLSLIGSTGAAYADDHHNMQLIYQGDHPSAIRTDGADTARLAELAAFVDSTRATGRSLADIDFWQGTVVLANAVEASMNSGQACQRVGERYELN